MGEKKEYIERGALLKTPPFTKYGGDLSAYVEGYLDCAEDAKQAVEEAPAADVVEVVRCKDCINNTENGGDCDRVLIHTHRNLVTETNEYLYFRLNYCEYGERREQT